MVASVRGGEKMRSVARRVHRSLSTVQLWVERAKGKELDSVDWADRSSAPHCQPNRTDCRMEAMIIETRHHLRVHSDLGEYGAEAVRRELLEKGIEKIPSVRTINRIFERWGQLDHHRTQRRKAPPKGWYLPEVAEQRCELDEFDLVEDLKIKDGPLVEVLNVVSLHGGLAGSWPQAASIKATDVVQALSRHWQSWGLPGCAQFDNDALFQGAHQHRDTISQVMRLCLSLGVTPVFVPPAEKGFQAAIEGYNGKWQAKVWARFTHESLGSLQRTSARYIKTYCQRTRQRQDSAPQRGLFPKQWQLDLQVHPADYPAARLVYIRRTNQQGMITMLGRSFPVDRNWTGRLVRCEVLLTEARICFYQLRRRAPKEQPMLNEIHYEIPRRPFRN